MLAEIDRVAGTSNFNGVKLLDGSFTTQSFQVGANAGETVTIDSIASSKTSDLGTYQGANVSSTSFTGSETAAAQSVTFTYSDASSEVLSLGTVADDAKDIAAAFNALGRGFVATADSNVVAGTTSAAAVTGSGDNAADSFTLNGETFTITAGTDASANRQNLADAVNAISGTTGVTAIDDGAGVDLTATDGRNITLTFAADSSGGTDAVLADYGLALTSAAVNESTYDLTFVRPDANAAGATVASFVGSGTGSATAVGNLASTTISQTGSALSALDISTVAGANTALTTVDAALTTVNESRAELGAYQNRFESVISSTLVASENAEASRSRISDTDFAAETANLAKAQVLQQAGISVLAQANAQPQSVLALLQ